MSVITIDYDSLKMAAWSLQNGAEHTRHYADRLDSRISGRLTDLEGGCTGHAEASRDLVERKRSSLVRKAVEMDSLASALRSLQAFAQEQDSRVSDYIRDSGDEFAAANDIRCTWIEEAWSWLAGGVSAGLNRTEFGQWINDSFRKLDNGLADRWESLKKWYSFEGGKYIVDMVGAVAAVALAVVAIVLAAATIGGVCAIIAGVIAIAGGIIKLCNSGNAYLMRETNPAMARMLNKTNDLPSAIVLVTQGTVMEEFGQVAATTVQVVDTVCTMVSLADSATKVYESLTGRSTMFQKYLGENGVIENIFTKDVSGGNSLLRQTRTYDALRQQWYQLDGSGNYVLDINGNPLTVDLSDADKLQWSWKTGFRRLNSTVFPRDGSMPRVTGGDYLGAEIGSDLRSLPKNLRAGAGNIGNGIRNAVVNGGGDVAYDLKTVGLLLTEQDAGGREAAVSIRAAAANTVNFLTHLTGLDDVKKSIESLKEGESQSKTLEDVTKIIKGIRDLPANAARVVEGAWNELKPATSVDEILEQKIDGTNLKDLIKKYTVIPVPERKSSLERIDRLIGQF